MSPELLPTNPGWYGGTPLQAEAGAIAPGVELIRLSGDLDLDTAATALERICGPILPPVRIVLLDLSAVTFCNSSGIGVLVEAARRLAVTGVRLRLIGAGRPVRRPLEVTGLDRHFSSYPSIEDALLGESIGTG